MLKYRLITGPALILALLALVWLDHRLDPGDVPAAGSLPRGTILLLLSLCVMPLAAIELNAVMRASGIAAKAWLSILAALAGLSIFFVSARCDDPLLAASLPPTTAAALLSIALLTFSRHRTVRGVLPAAGGVLLVFVYLGLFLGFLLALRQIHSAWLIVGVILTTKACDTGAYFTGRAIGRRKLIPWLSPGKTWEGLIGGLVLAAIVGGVMAALAGPIAVSQTLPWWFGAACGVLFGGVGQLGDLIMSLFKRGAGLKDASHILPGMGGIMDVLDSPLLVAPVAFWVFYRLMPFILPVAS